MPSPTDRFGARILIVDDQQSNIRLLEFALRRGGYVAVTSTTRPEEVSALHLQNRYDLIILDLQMPRMDGFEVMKALKDTPGEQPVILVMTADPSRKLAALEAGATSFLSKPFLLPELVLRAHLLLDTATPPDAGAPAAVQVSPCEPGLGGPPALRRPSH